MKQFSIFILSILLCLIFGNVPTRAQTPPKELYVSPDNTFSFQYPQGWGFDEYNGEMSLSNQGTTTWDTRTREGEIRLRIVPPSRVAVTMLAEYPIRESVSLHPEYAIEIFTHELLRIYLMDENSLSTDSNCRAVKRTVAGEYEGYFCATDIRDNEQLTMLTVDLENGAFAGINTITLTDEWASFESIVLDIAASMRFDPGQTLLSVQKLSLSDSYVYHDLSFDYPAQWAVMDIFVDEQTTVLFMSNTLWAFVDLLREQSPPRPGQFLAWLMEPYDLQVLASSLDNPSLTDVLFALARTGPGNFGESEEFVLDGKHAALVRGQITDHPDKSLEYFALIVEIQPQVFAAFSVASNAENMDFLEEMFREIAVTLQYSPT